MNRKRKKPTNKEMETHVNTLFKEVMFLRGLIQENNFVLSHFIKFTGTEDKFKEYIKDQIPKPEAKDESKKKEKEEKNVVMPDRRSNRTQEKV